MALTYTFPYLSNKEYSHGNSLFFPSVRVPLLMGDGWIQVDGGRGGFGMCLKGVVRSNNVPGLGVVCITFKIA